MVEKKRGPKPGSQYYLCPCGHGFRSTSKNPVCPECKKRLGSSSITSPAAGKTWKRGEKKEKPKPVKAKAKKAPAKKAPAKKAPAKKAVKKAPVAPVKKDVEPVAAPAPEAVPEAPKPPEGEVVS